ncbi:hypothetical protein SEA_VANLEE_160 [Gordonia phage VanLee]|uniref:Uncharacterized protein n=1 Tax=Gordonia phage VanLee TaxID=2845816 RepID=A0A8F2IFI9_9CAUD|nr:hypothetical protein QEH49_gp130 [Gordonia phage VanLee]QWS68276.1 hypothetical protein SEA_VANLEE_160 [Gordonia phage VanLee]
MSTTNVWTETAIAQDIHAGDPVQARLIRRENNLYGHETCGNCGGQAHYKHSVGTHKCIECDALKLRGPDRQIEWSRC